MKIGTPKEIKPQEYRVGLTPASVAELISHGHQVSVESGAGAGAGFPDEIFKRAGATVVADADNLFANMDLIVKVKEPTADERKRLRKGQILFTYLHLASDQKQTNDLMESGATCIAYETVTDEHGGLPLLKPMSEIAGRLATQAGALHLQKHNGGRGLLLSGATGVPAANVAIIGGGTVGRNACRIALGMGARVTVLDSSMTVLENLERQFGSTLQTVHASSDAISREVLQADLVIGAILAPGGAADKVIPEALVKRMLPGSVLVDVAIDQGGCAETSRPTTHENPTYVVHDVVHYCVSNMPGAVPGTASLALNNATLPFVLELADKGLRQALEDNRHLREGLNVMDGSVTQREVADDLELNYSPAGEVLSRTRTGGE